MRANHHPRRLAQVTESTSDFDWGCAAAGGIRRGRRDAAVCAPVIRRLPAAAGILLLPAEVFLFRPDRTGADLRQRFRWAGGNPVHDFAVRKGRAATDVGAGGKRQDLSFGLRTHRQPLHEDRGTDPAGSRALRVPGSARCQPPQGDRGFRDHRSAERQPAIGRGDPVRALLFLSPRGESGQDAGVLAFLATRVRLPRRRRHGPEEVIAQVPQASGDDVNRAVAAAKAAFEEGPWATTTAQERGRVLFRLADKVRQNLPALAELECRNTGKPIVEAEYDLNDVATCFEYYGGLATKVVGYVNPVPDNAMSLSLKEPMGVAGQIIPWNYPLMMAAWKLAPALAAGCTCVLKPAEQTPLTALELAKWFEEVGLPRGV